MPALLLAAAAPAPPAGGKAVRTNDVVAVTNAGKEWLREVEITVEPGGFDWEAHYSVRIMPDRTQVYDAILLELFYRQEVAVNDGKGKASTKIYEPVSFKYRRADVSLVDDLDHHVSFRVPVGRDVLVSKHGDGTFVKDRPIAIERITMTGIVNGSTVWTYEFGARGKFIVAEVAARQRAEEARKKKVKEEDLGDLVGAPKWLK